MNADHDHHARTPAYRVDDGTLRFLEDLNESLATFEARLRRELAPASLPITIVGGLQRSGTTLLSQLLVQFCDVAYVDNLVARFWKTPLVGATLSHSLFGGAARPASRLVSDYGVTDDIRGPHEFGYFWTDWLRLDHAATHVLTPDEAARVDWSGLACCLRQLSSVYGLPLVLKNPIACFNAPHLFEEFAGMRAIVVRRNPFYVVQSTYLARKDRYGDVGQWWSLKPPSYEEIRKEMDPIRQIAAQVEESRRLFEGLVCEHPDRCITVEYQDLRTRTGELLVSLADFCDCQVREGLVLPSAEELPDGDRVRVSPEEARRIEQALADLS